MEKELIQKGPSLGLPDPTPEMLETPEFNAVWECIKRWDIEVKPGDGYAGATGNHVRAILDALEDCRPKEKESVRPTSDSACTRVEKLSVKLLAARIALEKTMHFCHCHNYDDHVLFPDRSSLEARVSDAVTDVLAKLEE